LAVAGLLAAGRRQLSLVDCASFAVLRAEGQREAFAFDRHFQEEGFRLL
jgi:predicted nucleic acid-binding protein